MKSTGRGANRNADNNVHTGKAEPASPRERTVVTPTDPVNAPKGNLNTLGFTDWNIE